MKTGKKLLRPLLFALGGAAAGFLYDRLVGCAGGCVIAASPVRSVVYLGIVGLLLSAATAPAKKEA